MIPGVKQLRSIRIHEPLTKEPLLYNAARGITLFRNLHSIPEIPLLRGLREHGGHHIQFPDLDAAS